MERIQINANSRGQMKKSERKRLRKEGKVPAVVYGRELDSKSLTVSVKDLNRVLGTSAGENVLLTLNIQEENNEYPVMFKEIQRDPIKEHYLHVDFYAIDLKEKLEVSVPLNIIGEPQGAEEGGVAQYQLREIELSCLPTNIPDSVDVDVSEVGLNESLSAGELALPEGAELVTDPEETIMSVVIVEEEPAAPAEDEELEEGEEPEEEAEESEEGEEE